MPYITSTSYKDVFGLYPDGCSTAVSTEAEILLREKVELYDIPPACNENPQPYKWLLKVNDPVKGVLWIDETEESFNAKVVEAYCCPGGGGGSPFINSVIGTPGNPPAGLTVTYTVLIGATLSYLSVRGLDTNPDGRLDDVTGTIDLTDIGGVADGDYIHAEYNYNI